MKKYFFKNNSLIISFLTIVFVCAACLSKELDQLSIGGTIIATTTFNKSTRPKVWVENQASIVTNNASTFIDKAGISQQLINEVRLTSLKMNLTSTTQNLKNIDSIAVFLMKKGEKEQFIQIGSATKVATTVSNELSLLYNAESLPNLLLSDSLIFQTRVRFLDTLRTDWSVKYTADFLISGTLK